MKIKTIYCLVSLLICFSFSQRRRRTSSTTETPPDNNGISNSEDIGGKVNASKKPRRRLRTTSTTTESVTKRNRVRGPSATTEEPGELLEVSTRFFTGNPTIDGGIVGALGGLVAGFLGGNILNNLGGGNNCNGRRRRQAPGENQVGTRFLGLDFLFGKNDCKGNDDGGGNDGSDNPIPQSDVKECKCNYNLMFEDKNGNVYGACRRKDKTGKRWCYIDGYVCPDAKDSKKFPNNPWSYQACGGVQ